MYVHITDRDQLSLGVEYEGDGGFGAACRLSMMGTQQQNIQHINNNIGERLRLGVSVTEQNVYSKIGT